MDGGQQDDCKLYDEGTCKDGGCTVTGKEIYKEHGGPENILGGGKCLIACMQGPTARSSWMTTMFAFAYQ
jgi:hypothetical protein